MALNQLKKWIGTQAMTAFFDQLNDNVDATNAAIDLAESHLADYATEIEKKAYRKQEEWTNLAPKNEWSASSGYARVFKDEFGMVHLMLYVSGGIATGGTTIITLPPDCRPDITLVLDTGAGSFMISSSTGDMTFAGTQTRSRVAMCIEFRAAS